MILRRCSVPNTCFVNLRSARSASLGGEMARPSHNLHRHLPIVCPFWQVRLILFEISSFDRAIPKHITTTHQVLLFSKFTNSMHKPYRCAFPIDLLSLADSRYFQPFTVNVDHHINVFSSSLLQPCQLAYHPHYNWHTRQRNHHRPKQAHT